MSAILNLLEKAAGYVGEGSQFIGELAALDQHFRSQGAGGVADVLERLAVQATGVAAMPQSARYVPPPAAPAPTAAPAAAPGNPAPTPPEIAAATPAPAATGTAAPNC